MFSVCLFACLSFEGLFVLSSLGIFSLHLLKVFVPLFSLVVFVFMSLSFIWLCTCLSSLGICICLSSLGPPRERKVPGSNPACAGIFSGSSHTSDLHIGTPVATLPGAWRCRVSAGTGRPGVSIL